jgi:hypothetical protein
MSGNITIARTLSGQIDSLMQRYGSDAFLDGMNRQIRDAYGLANAINIGYVTQVAPSAIDLLTGAITDMHLLNDKLTSKPCRRCDGTKQVPGVHGWQRCPDCV